MSLGYIMSLSKNKRTKRRGLDRQELQEGETLSSTKVSYGSCCKGTPMKQSFRKI